MRLGSEFKSSIHSCFVYISNNKPKDNIVWDVEALKMETKNLISNNFEYTTRF